MSGIATAIVVTGAVSAYTASEAAEEASAAQSAAAEAAKTEEQRQFDITQQQMQPYYEAGTAALAQQQALLGIGPGGAEEQAAAMAAFAETPGQQFLREQQERALLRNASATGQLGGANTQVALQEQAFLRAQTDLANYQNQLAGISGTGQTTAFQTGQLGAQSAQQAGLYGMAGAEARASGILGQQQAYATGTEQIMGGLSQAGYFTPQQTTTVPIQGGGTAANASVNPLMYAP